MKRKTAIQTSKLISLFLAFIVLYSAFTLCRFFLQSYIQHKKDRVNVVFYGEHPSIISIGYEDRVNYIGFFDQGSAVYVPGGYGNYKLGALGRLLELEKNPTLLQKTFSSVLSTYIDFYFYPKKSRIYSFDPPPGKQEFFIPRLSLLDVFFTYNYNTNAGFFDRLQLFITMLDKKRTDFSRLVIKSVTDEVGDRIFMESRFDKKYQGYFYEKTLRDEGKSVQILYTNYKSATILTRIIEGEGIRVADLTKNKKPTQQCILQEAQEKPSHAATFLQSILGCKREKGTVEDADILLILGEKLEREWE